MTKIKDLTIQQREKGLIELIEDAKKFNFNHNLIKKYEAQLKQVQKEIKRDKERQKNFNSRMISKREDTKWK